MSGGNGISLMESQSSGGGVEFRIPMGDREISDQEKVHQRTKLDLTWRSGMFRPTTLRHEGPPRSAAWKCYGVKYCLISTPLSFLENVRANVLTLDHNSQIINNIPVAGHKGLLCVDFEPLPYPRTLDNSTLIVCKVCNSFEEQENTLLPRQDHIDQKNNLVHIRVVDDKGNYNVLIAGNYTSDTNPQHLIRFTEEYSSETKRWESAGHPNFEGLFEKDSFQNGAYLKKPRLELLFCITTLVTSMGRLEKILVKYDFKRKGWGRIDRVQIIVEDYFRPSGMLQVPSGGLQLLGVEEFGGIIFLFTEQEYTNEDLCVIIHKLDIDRSGSLSWRETMRRQRQRPRNTDNTARVGFIVYPNTTWPPSQEDVDRSGGCVFAFKLTCSLESSSEHVTIHELEDFNYDSASDQAPRWGWKNGETKMFDPRDLSLSDNYKLKTRNPNWTADEQKLFALLQEEARRLRLKPGFPTWNFISVGLWELGGFDRRPKSCQQRGDSLHKQTGAEAAAVRKRKGAPKPPPDDTAHVQLQISSRSSLQANHSLVTRSENTAVIIDSSAWADHVLNDEYGGQSGDGGSFSPRTAPPESPVRQVLAANVNERLASTLCPTSIDAGTSSSPTAPALSTSNILLLAANAHLSNIFFDDHFTRLKKYLESNGIKFTEDQEVKLLVPKIDELDVLKAKVKEANLKDSRIQEPDTTCSSWGYTKYANSIMLSLKKNQQKLRLLRLP